MLKQFFPPRGHHHRVQYQNSVSAASNLSRLFQWRSHLLRWVYWSHCLPVLSIPFLHARWYIPFWKKYASFCSPHYQLQPYDNDVVIQAYQNNSRVPKSLNLGWIENCCKTSRVRGWISIITGNALINCIQTIDNPLETYFIICVLFTMNCTKNKLFHLQFTVWSLISQQLAMHNILPHLSLHHRTEFWYMENVRNLLVQGFASPDLLDKTEIRNPICEDDWFLPAYPFVQTA